MFRFILRLTSVAVLGTVATSETSSTAVLPAMEILVLIIIDVSAIRPAHGCACEAGSLIWYCRCKLLRRELRLGNWPDICRLLRFAVVVI